MRSQKCSIVLKHKCWCWKNMHAGLPSPPPRSPHVHTPKIIPFAFHSNASFLFILPQNVIVSCHSGRFFYENVGKHWNLHDVRIEMVLPIHTSSCSWVLELGQKCRWESWKVSVQHSIVTKVWYPPPLPTTRSDSQASGLCPGMYSTNRQLRLVR